MLRSNKRNRMIGLEICNKPTFSLPQFYNNYKRFFLVSSTHTKTETVSRLCHIAYCSGTTAKKIRSSVPLFIMVWVAPLGQ